MGDLRCLIVTADGVGVMLDWHTHGVHDAHITICARGGITLETSLDGGHTVVQSHDVDAGGCIDTPAFTWHRITARTPDARVFNIVKEPLLGE